MPDAATSRRIWGVPLYPTLVVLGCLFIIIGTKFFFIHSYGSDLPFWDQWDAEGAAMFMPAAQGHLAAKDFLQPHNEHRILFTRLLAFGLERLNGQWDARLEMTVNVFIHALAMGLLLLVLRPLIKANAWVIACLLTTLICSLPLSWENTLAGFQSQFYFLLLFSIGHLAGTFAAKEKSFAWYAGQMSGLCSVFSMASGFFSALVALMVIIADTIRLRRAPTPTRLALAVFNGFLIVLGLMLKTTVAGHEALKAHGLSELISSVVNLLAWPSPYWPCAFLVLLPAVIFFITWLRDPNASTAKLFVLSMITWAFLQIAALAVARGGNPTVLSSRYMDLLTISVIMTAVLWYDHTRTAAPSGPKRVLLHAACAVWWLGLVMGFISQYRSMTTTFIHPMKDFNRQRIDVVRNYVQTKSNDLFKAEPVVSLPYPSATRLAWLLDDPGIRAVLPPSIRPNLPMQSEANATSGFVESDVSKPGGTPIGYPYWTNASQTAKAQFESKPIEKSKESLVRLLVKSPSAANDIQLLITDGDHRAAIVIPPNAKNQWQAVNVRFSGRSFKIIAESSPGASVFFSAPIEVPFVGWLCVQILTLWPLVVGFGVACALFGFLGTFFQHGEKTN